MKEKSIVSAITLFTSLSAYFYARHIEKDPVPVVMVSGFFGAMLGEALVKWLYGDDDNNNPPPNFT
ncbi:MAG: hypothetical protein ACOZCO_10535 [Bacteroidota bacterium]